MFHNSCYVVLDLAVVPNPLFHNSFNFFVDFFVNFFRYFFYKLPTRSCLQSFKKRVDEDCRESASEAHLSIDWKKLDGAKLHGAKLFQRNCQDVPGAAGAAAGAAAASAAASAACT